MHKPVKIINLKGIFYPTLWDKKYRMENTKCPLDFREASPRRTFASSYDALNEWHSRAKQNFILEMYLRVFSTNILIFEQPSEYSGDTTSKVWGEILKYLSPLHVRYLRRYISEIRKHDFDKVTYMIISPYLFFTPKPFQKLFHSQSVFSFKIFILVFYVKK